MKSVTVVLFALITLGLTSCTTDSVAETEDLYIQSPDGDETDPKDGKD